jgi:hypothetical protein
MFGRTPSINLSDRSHCCLPDLCGLEVETVNPQSISDYPPQISLIEPLEVELVVLQSLPLLLGSYWEDLGRVGCIQAWKLCRELLAALDRLFLAPPDPTTHQCGPLCKAFEL